MTYSVGQVKLTSQKETAEQQSYTQVSPGDSDVQYKTLWQPYI